MSPKSQSNRWLVCFLLFVSFLLPLVSVPGLASTFSTPKLILVGSVLALGLPVAAALGVAPFRFPFLLEAVLFLWLTSLSVSSIFGVVVSTTALLTQLFGVGWLAFVVLVQPPVDELAGAIILSGAGISIVALLQYLGIDPFVLAGWSPLTIGDRRMRVYSTLGNPNF
ncbi:MAG: hypothetical protein L0312_25810, partial [Acidobacteria bacterium]|nr:hypothetical protein [Acidobacteriota bacterium]